MYWVIRVTEFAEFILGQQRDNGNQFTFVSVIHSDRRVIDFIFIGARL